MFVLNVCFLKFVFKCPALASLSHKNKRLSYAAREYETRLLQISKGQNEQIRLWEV